MQLFEKLIDHPEAVSLVLENTPRLPVARVPLVEARGLALAEDVRAGFDSPPFEVRMQRPDGPSGSWTRPRRGTRPKRGWGRGRRSRSSPAGSPRGAPTPS